MKRKFLFLAIFSIGNSFALSNGTWSTFLSAYSKSDLNTLTQLANKNSDNAIIDYLAASANLDKQNPEPSLQFVQNADDGYLRNDTLHQLVDFYFNKQDWNNFLKVYAQLPTNQASSNETCGYDLANFALNNHQPAKSDFKYLIANRIPLWCISLIASKLNNKSLDSSYQKPFLYSLITNNQLSQFNQLADSLGFKAVNFTSSVAATGLNNPYQIVYRINSLSVKSPDVAYSELGSSSLDKFTRQYLYNQVADNLAIKQMFSLSLNAMKQGSQDWISDDEYEWQVRSYLYANNWSSVLATINAMPDKLQSKSSWLYWKAYAAGKLGQNSLATQTLQKIPSEYNYYSLLAQAELQTPLNIDYQPETNKLSQLKYANDVKQSFALYQTAKDINSSILTRIATNSLYYVIKNSNDADIAAISKRALSLGWNDMSIYAANHLQHKSATMSFPLLFTSQYKHYAGQNNIPPSYPMAVTRQESRFNPNALAWDGGVGLMQIMPATAAYIAKKLKSSNCFKNYECNIQFGTWFLAHLVTKFGNNPIYAAAGYNAGPGRAHRWQQVFQDKDNRVQIELIPFNVTRDYVQKVVSNKLIYDALLQNNQSVNMLAFLSKINNKNVDFIVDDDDTNGDASGSQQPQ